MPEIFFLERRDIELVYGDTKLILTSFVLHPGRTLEQLSLVSELLLIRVYLFFKVTRKQMRSLKKNSTSRLKFIRFLEYAKISNGVRLYNSTHVNAGIPFDFCSSKSTRIWQSTEQDKRIRHITKGLK